MLVAEVGDSNLFMRPYDYLQFAGAGLGLESALRWSSSPMVPIDDLYLQTLRDSLRTSIGWFGRKSGFIGTLPKSRSERVQTNPSWRSAQMEKPASSPIQPPWLEQVAWQSFTYYPRLRKVSQYVEAHLCERLTVQDAARVACCEYKYFSAYFRAKVNICFTDWVRLVRVVEATRLLRAGDLTVYQTARQVGFRNVRALERAFRCFCSCTPADYRTGVHPDGRGVDHERRRTLHERRRHIHE